MAGIAGVAKPGQWQTVRRMLEKISHRGEDNVVVDRPQATIGEIHSRGVKMWLGRTGQCSAVCDGVLYNWQNLCEECFDVDQAIEAAYANDGASFLRKIKGSFALAIGTDDGLFLARDGLGIAPLYYGESDGKLCFASEVKALVGIVEHVHEFPPGHYYHPNAGFVRFHEMKPICTEPAAQSDAAAHLREQLEQAVARCVAISSDVGCWLSGGLDSSVLAALLSAQQPRLETFAIGTPGASDLEWAEAVSRHIGSQHHEVHTGCDDLLGVLEDVIYHLESFDALLVRSSLTNFLVAKVASDHVDTVLSGEGGDELFAGYDYLAGMGTKDLVGELTYLTAALHNTALQRVDRCSRAHGLVAHTPYLDPDVVDYARGLPPDVKLHGEGQVVSKWVLRQAAAPILPDKISQRPKVKFWQGAGVTDLIASEADKLISDSEFEKGRSLPAGGTLNSKEEFLYFKVFTDHFGRFDDYSFVGRTKQQPPRQ